MARRWNGWGDDGVSAPLPSGATRLLPELIGAGVPPRDASFRDALTAAPASRLAGRPGISTDTAVRLLHARGQSLPDWIALRSGRVGAVPDGVAFPGSADAVRELVRGAEGRGLTLIPYGGGTSVVGHVNPLPSEAPVLTVDLNRMSRLLAFDEASRLATFEAGVMGPELEAHLRARGYTLGHFPQSFEYSTLGGWIATRSSGQESLGYGRMEWLFAGGRLEAPSGSLVLPPFPASAAGPDLRELVLGSEGRLGIVTDAVVRVSPIPERDEVDSYFFPDFPSALDAARELAGERLPLTMLRLSDAHETETTLALAGHERLLSALERYLALRGAGPGKCLLLAGCAGRSERVRATRRHAAAISSRHKGIAAGTTFGREWKRHRFRAPYLRNALWEAGYAVDTLETAAPWSRVPALHEAVGSALRGALGPMGERAHVFTHLSHVYPDGSSLYTTYLFRIAADPDETLERWRRLKHAASSAIVAGGGTISHQHGVGLDHLPYLPAEKGELGLSALSAVARAFDPEGVMNPGKLLP